MVFSLGFGKSKSRGSSSSSGTRDQTQTQNSTQKQTGRTTGSELTSQQQSSRTGTTSQTSGEVLSEQLLSSLDEQTQQTLQNLIGQLSEDTGEGSAIGQALGNLALNSGVDSAPIVANARRKGEIAVGQSQQKLARGVGSSMNSLVQQFGLEEGRALETELASLEASLQQQNQSSQLEALSTAFSAEQAGGQNQITQIVQLADVLKGATQTQTGSQTSSETATQLVEALSSLTGSKSTEELQSLITSLMGTTKLNESFKEKGTSSNKSKGAGFGLSL